MPTIISRGAFSGKAFGLTGQTTSPVYVEDVFSTYLYTGNGSTQTITNNIDLSTKGGLVWLKNRTGTYSHYLWDTARGAGYFLSSNDTGGQFNIGTTEGVSFLSSGFSMGNNINWNGSAITAASWTFRKQPKFFDVVTYTGDGTNNRQIPHALGSTPGMIICKRTGSAGDWWVYHVGMGSYSAYLKLNTTAAAVDSGGTPWGQPPTSTYFVTDASGVNGFTNANGQPYVAYLFANQAGGFGLSGSDSVVACGGYTGPANVNLGWEPQWILTKKITNNNGVLRDWMITDVMRGLKTAGQYANGLFPNTSGSETSQNEGVYINSTGFTTEFDRAGGSGESYIYVAIRRGPMKVPTSGTSVFSVSTGTYTNLSTDLSYPWTFATDLILYKGANASSGSDTAGQFADRLRGFSLFGDYTTASTSTTLYLSPSNINAETTNGKIGIAPTAIGSYGNRLPIVFAYGTPANGSATGSYYGFRRAPGFMDVVCYTGTGVARTVAHNLGVAPELIIVKSRNRTGIYVSGWPVYSSSIGVSNALSLNETTPSQAVGTAFWNSTAPTSSVFSLGTNDSVNAASNGNLYVAYLFATCPGVSKVGSYTGTGAAQNINCGFSAGARFVLIKRTDSTGDWYVYDSARGISSGSDPYLLLNSTAAEVTGTNYVDTFASGFTLTATAPAALNANGGSYLFLAIA